MTAPKWPRPQWHDGGGEALLIWFVFGDFTADLAIDAARYRTRGLPDGIEVVRYQNRALERWDGYPLAGTLGRLLWEEDSALFERAKAAGECCMVRGTLPDAPDLDGLRDVVGSIAALCESGGVAVVDPQILSMFGAADFVQRYFGEDRFVPRDHVLILSSDDPQSPGRHWVHTRGLRKVARPDVSIRNLPQDALTPAGELAQRFLDFQCAGGLVEEGREIKVGGLPGGMFVRHAGSEDDPDFNNRHFELRWPE